MNSYINEHKLKRIVGYTQTNLIEIKIGNIINFNYDKATHNKNPYILVLNPRWKNKLHGLIIDYMTLMDLDKLRDFIIEEAEEIKPDTVDNLDVSLQTLSTVSQTPNVFYNVRLKDYLKKYFSKGSVYRIYDVEHVSNIKLVKYNFNK